MTQEPPTVQQVHLYNLANFCAALDETLRQGGLTANESAAVWHVAVSAECLGCAMQVSGEELQALSQPPSVEAGSAKINRMRLGDCARPGCNSYYYRLQFQRDQRVDWPGLVSRVQTRVPEPIGLAPVRPRRRLPWRSWARPAFVRRLGIAVVIIVALLLVREWRQGGQIPLLHEPEQFRVDPAPEEPRGE